MKKELEILGEFSNFLKTSKEQGLKYISKETVKKFDKIGEKLTKKIQKKQLKEQHLNKIKTLSELEEIVSNCNLCELHKGRKNVVFGEGSNNPLLMLIGEAPGREEDLTGRPFVGKSGELLTKMLRAINIERQEVFITSVVKCRPPRNRTPLAKEISACFPYLLKQIELLNPKLILCLGATAAKSLLGEAGPLSEIRGKFFDIENKKLIVTYHPAFLLRFSGNKLINLKRQAWHDLQLLQREYERLKNERA